MATPLHALLNVVCNHYMQLLALKRLVFADPLLLKLLLKLLLLGLLYEVLSQLKAVLERQVSLIL